MRNGASTCGVHTQQLALLDTNSNHPNVTIAMFTATTRLWQLAFFDKDGNGEVSATECIQALDELELGLSHSQAPPYKEGVT